MRWLRSIWGKEKNRDDEKDNNDINVLSEESETAKAEAIVELPRALVFIDYEHWVYGMRNLFGLSPDPLGWRNELSESYQLVKVSVFANFGDQMMSDHLSQIRQITNTIYETRTSTNRAPKDMTDFVMLDNIYQSLDDFDDIDTYIIFTGDGHFQSVARYLKQRRGKRVVVYGIKGSISRALTAIADECIELPLDGQVLRQHVTHILENLDHFDINRKTDQYATFRRTAEVVARHYELDEQQVQAALSWLIDKDYIKRVMVNPRDDVEVRALKVDWEKVEADNLWKPREL